MALKFDLDRSDYYKKRMELLRSQQVPKLSDANANYGPKTAQMIFGQCEEALREDFGLKTPLQGPGSELWVSPSDLLIGKLALKPPFTPKCLQALTHQGILDIGRDIESRFLQEMEQEKQRALDKLRAEILATIDDRIKTEIKDAEIRERLNCQAEMEKLQLEFDLTLKEELNKLEELMMAEHDRIMAVKKDDLQRMWERRLQEEVENTVDSITKEFIEKLNEQQQKLTQLFEMELKKQEVLREVDAKTAKVKTHEALRQLQHSLECTNLVNMMYILCTERKKCCMQKQQMENHYQTILTDLKKTVKDHEEEIALMRKRQSRQAQDIMLRERCLAEVIKQFQKFINFALRAAPTQAEFLLSVEKMLVFELAETVAKTEVSYLKPVPQILAWKEAKEPEEQPLSLEIEDHHRCLNELNPPVLQEIGIDDDLPAMYFKNKMYVREDYRDMLAGGVELRPSNELWSRDVEILVDTWRKMSKEKIKIAECSTNDPIKEENEEMVLKTSSNISSICEPRKSKQSQVKFTDSASASEQKDSNSSKRLRRKSSLKPFTVDSNEILTSNEVESTNILAARDSYELLSQKLKSSNFSKESEDNDISHEIIPEIEISNLNGNGKKESKELGVDTRDSVLLRKISLAKKPSSTDFSLSPKDSIELLKESKDKNDIRSKSSKLVLARNSVELLRESMHKIQKDYSSCIKKESVIPAGICCDQCGKKRSSFTESLPKLSYPKMYNSKHTMSIVSFHMEPKIVETTKEPKNKPLKTRKKAGKISKAKRVAAPVYKVKVVGDKEITQWEENDERFTTERIHSLINLMKEHPNLLQLFTAGSR